MCSAYQTKKFDQNYVLSQIISSVCQMTFKLSAMDCLEPKDVVGYARKCSAACRY